jgi:hypothetical protein
MTRTTYGLGDDDDDDEDAALASSSTTREEEERRAKSATRRLGATALACAALLAVVGISRSNGAGDAGLAVDWSRLGLGQTQKDSCMSSCASSLDGVISALEAMPLQCANVTANYACVDARSDCANFKASVNAACPGTFP